MHGPRVVSIVLALAAVSMLATGTLGFTSVSAERGISVNVVSNESAYVGVTACEPTHGNESDANASKGNGEGNADLYVTVANRYSGTVTVEDISANAHDVELDDHDRTITSGDWQEYPLHLDVDATEVTVDVDGDGFDASVTADVQQQPRHDCNPGNGGSDSVMDD